MTNPANNSFNVNSNWKKIAAPLAVVAGVGLSGCSFFEDPAKTTSRNLSTAADNFEINRRIVFYNGITGDYMFVIEGKCSIEVDGVKKKLDVICKTGDQSFKKHFLGLSDNVTFFAEQIDGANVNTYNYRVSFNPQSIIPDIRFRGDTRSLLQAITPGATPLQPAPATP